MPLSVIGAGMGRTGTMSLKAALETLGFGPCCHLSTIVQTPSLWSAWSDIIDGKSRDWRDWNGGCQGYEGLLCDGYLTLLCALDEAKASGAQSAASARTN